MIIFLWKYMGYIEMITDKLQPISKALLPVFRLANNFKIYWLRSVNSDSSTYCILKSLVSFWNSCLYVHLFIPAGDLNLNVVAMALSGFTDEKNTLWHQMVATQSTMLQNPYLRTMFTFLTAEVDRYEDMLVSSF